jgi:hypothetical protein
MKSSAVNGTVTTGVSEEATADVFYGLFVVQGVNQDGVKLPAGATDIPMGVSTLSHADHISYVGANPGVVPKAPVNVTRKGRVFVTSEDAVTPASKVFMRWAANGANTQKGSIRGTADTGAVEVYGCAFVGSCAAGGTVELEVDLLTNKSFIDHG